MSGFFHQPGDIQFTVIEDKRNPENVHTLEAEKCLRTIIS